MPARSWFAPRHFTPVAGYIPSRAAIKYLAKQRDMEVWLAPIAGTRVLVPFRAQGPTPIGQAMLEAYEFVSRTASRPELGQWPKGAVTSRLTLSVKCESTRGVNV